MIGLKRKKLTMANTRKAYQDFVGAPEVPQFHPSMVKKKPRKELNLDPDFLRKQMDTLVRGAIRRSFKLSDLRKAKAEQNVRKVPRYCKDGSRHKVDAVEQLCEGCGKWVMKSTMDVDHTVPVIDPTLGFVDYNTFVANVYAGHSLDNLKNLCPKCHEAKTTEEKAIATVREYLPMLAALEAETVTTRDRAREIIKSLQKVIQKEGKSQQYLECISRAKRIIERVTPVAKQKKSKLKVDQPTLL